MLLVTLSHCLLLKQKFFKSGVDWSSEMWDKAYMDAINSGNIQETQRLRDLHFKQSAPNTKFQGIYYHGSSKSFNIFDPKLIGSTDQGWMGRGYYFTPNEEYGKMYGKTRGFYLNATTPMEGSGISWFNKDIPQVLTKNNPKLMEVEKRSKLADSARGTSLQTQPYNGEFEEDVMKNNTQMKLADAVTYDDQGNIIPLSKRDNWLNPDIRYGLIPIGIGLGTTSLYNKK